MNEVTKLIQDKKFKKDLFYNQQGILKQIKGKENIEWYWDYSFSKGKKCFSKIISMRYIKK